MQLSMYITNINLQKILTGIQKISVTQMQASRLSKYGKSTLKNTTNFNLLQQIDYDDDMKELGQLKNHSTFFLDEEDHEVPVNGMKGSRQQLKDFSKKLDNQYQNRVQEMYQLPNALKKQTSNMASSTYSSRRKRQKQKQRSNLKQSRSTNYQERLAKTDRKQKALQRVNIKRDYAKQADFLSGDLFQIQDIIEDIQKIVSLGNHKKLIQPTQQKKQIKSKPRKFNFNTFPKNDYTRLDKLDQMLMSYMSNPTPDQREAMDAINRRQYEEHSRQSSQASYNARNRQKFSLNDMKNFTQMNNSQKKSVKFSKQAKNSSYPQLAFVTLNLNQIPIIATKWDKLYLKFQSYPQQQNYRKIVNKAYSLQVISYSIFTYSDVGLHKPSASQTSNNIQQYKLMSEQQYAKKWQYQYNLHNVTTTNDNNIQKEQLSQDQKQILMEFDIEWYRTLIDYCYHIGLEDLLDKVYDVQVYMDQIRGIVRLQEFTVKANDGDLGQDQGQSQKQDKIENKKQNKEDNKEGESKENDDDSYGDDFQPEGSMKKIADEKIEKIEIVRPSPQKFLQLQKLIQINQFRYVDQYFKQVYNSNSHEIILGLIRLNPSFSPSILTKKPQNKKQQPTINDKNHNINNPHKQQLKQHFNLIYNDNNQNKFTICSLLSTDNTISNNQQQYILIRHLCGAQKYVEICDDGICVILEEKKQPASVQMMKIGIRCNNQMKDYEGKIEILLRGAQVGNQWEVIFKVNQKQKQGEGIKIQRQVNEQKQSAISKKKQFVINKIALTEELLFGSLYKAQLEVRQNSNPPNQ